MPRISSSNHHLLSLAQRTKNAVWGRSLRAFMALMATVLAVSLGGGCAAEDDDSRSTGGDSPTTAHAIHVTARLPNGVRIPMTFGPATELGDVTNAGAALGTTQRIASASQPTSRDHHGPIDLHGVTPRTESPSLKIGNPSGFWESAWVLLLRSAYICDNIDIQAGWLGWLRGRGLWAPQSSANEEGTWFAFPRTEVTNIFGGPYPPPAAQPALSLSVSKRKQSLLCMADRLAEIADAPGTHFLPATGGASPYTCAALMDTIDAGYTYNADEPKGLDPDGCLFHAEWEIPPQSDADRFIVRDLAIHSLGILAGLDVQNPDLARGIVQPYEPGGIDFDVQVMRSAGSLLHDLIRRSVYSDMAAAEQKLSRALDPAKGADAAWAHGPALERFGSYAHAARILLGRWEIGDTPASFHGHGDPQCNGIRALESLPAAFDDFDTRAADYPIATQGEAAATALLERLGLIIPPACPIAAEVLRGAIADVAVVVTQVDSGLAPETGPAIRELYLKRLQEVSDAEIKASVERITRTRLLMDGAQNAWGCGTFPGPQGLEDPRQTRPPGDPERVKLERIAALPSVNAVHAIAVPGGLSRSRVQTDPIARASGMLLSNRCSLGTGAAAWGTSHPSTDIIPRVILQDAFHIGQALGRGLARLRTEASGQALAQTRSRASAAVAEVKAWAGSAWVRQASFWGEECDPNSGPGWRPQSLTTVVGGLDPADVGLKEGASPQDMANAIAGSFGVVYGWPWIAECAAGARSDCPPDFESKYVTRPQVTVVGAGDWTSQGWPGPSFSLNFAWDDPASKGVPWKLQHVSNHFLTKHAQRFFLVQTSGVGAGGKGRVLGPLSSKKNDAGAESTGFVIAPMQRELLDVVLNVGRWVGDKPPAVGGRSSSRANGYCVDGIARNVFVPLENEISGDSNGNIESSWKHYLALARQAANEADLLGNQLINQGFNIDERKEAADEALADICGNFGISNSASVDSRGNVRAGQSDPALAACLGEDAIDIAFVGSVLPTNTSPASLKGDDVLKCQTSSPKHELCAKTTLSVAKLGLVPEPTALPSFGGNEATYAHGLIASLRAESGLRSSELRAHLDKSKFAPEHVAALLSGVRFVVDPHNRWYVKYQDRVLMDSASGAPQWPGCLSNLSCAPADPASRQRKVSNELFNDAFRPCPLSVGLGDCDADVDAGAPSAGEEALNLLKLRVQAAVNLLAASTGSAPAGLFTIPVPVIHGDDPGGLAVLREARWKGSLIFIENQYGLDKFRFDQLSAAAIERIGDVWSVPEVFSKWPSDAAQEVPNWYLNIYNRGSFTTSRVRHAWRASGPIAYGHSPHLRDPAVRPSPRKEDWGTRQLPFSRIYERDAVYLQGARCNAARGAMPGKNLVARYRDLSSPLYGENFHSFIYEAQTSAPQWDAPSFSWASHFSDPFPSTQYRRIEFPEWTAGAWARPPSGRYVHLPWESLTRETNLSVMKGDDPGESPSQFFGYFMPTAPNGECGSLTHLLGAVAIVEAVEALPATGTDVRDPPPVRSIEDFAALQGWLASASERTKLMGSRMFVTNVPKRVVASLSNSGAVPGSQAGEIGATMRDFADGLTSLHTNWGQLANELKQIALTLEAARIGLARADIRRDAAATELALRQLQTQRELAEGVASMLRTAGTLLGDGVPNPTVFLSAASIGASAVSVGKTIQIMAMLPAVGLNDDKEHANEVRAVLNQLQSESSKHWGNVFSLIDGFKIGVNRCVDASERIRLLQRKAQYQVAKATLADFSGDVALPVNTVLRRQLGGTRIRYDRALQHAKALAYIARRSVEQRFGTPLSSIASSVGPLDAPASWADDVCSASGVNYETLRAASQNGDPGKQDSRAISKYADAWIGDYVTKLERFVDYYNVEFPLHEGDDTAVLSLRHDLMPATSECRSPSRNLLLYSGSLDQGVSFSVEGSGGSATQGWLHSGQDASDPDRLVALSGALLDAPRAGPGGDLAAVASPVSEESLGVTWLAQFAVSATPPMAPSTVVAPGMVYQQVELHPGRHVLSWWDQARTATGKFPPPAATVPAYAVRVYDSSGRELASHIGAPFVPSSTTPGSTVWSPRRAISFQTSTPGFYSVAFGASAGGTDGGSVAIANVQLEAARASTDPSAYVANGATPTVISTQCPPTEERFRSSFVRRCETNGRCYRELEAPLTIDTVALNEKASSHLGSLARGNYNYRHINIAANLVGTGIRYCGPGASPSCYTSAYLEYDFSHDGTDAQLVDHRGTPRYFDFGIGHIRHGKALTAERMITVPLSTNDQSLINQPGISHSEFRGRPVDGRYRLRIWESPNLEWEKLDDIQLVLQYRYWSAVTANGNQP